MIFQYEFQFWECDVNGLFTQNLHWCWKRNYKHASDHTRDLRDVMQHLWARTLRALPLIDWCLVSEYDMETNPRNHGRLEEKCVYPDQLLRGCWLTLGEIASLGYNICGTNHQYFTFLASIPVVLLVIALVVSRLLQLAVICMEDASMTANSWWVTPERNNPETETTSKSSVLLLTPTCFRRCYFYFEGKQSLFLVFAKKLVTFLPTMGNCGNHKGVFRAAPYTCLQAIWHSNHKQPPATTRQPVMKCSGMVTRQLQPVSRVEIFCSQLIEFGGTFLWCQHLLLCSSYILAVNMLS